MQNVMGEEVLFGVRGWRERTNETLLACSVPDLELDVKLVDRDSVCEKRRSVVWGMCV